MTKILDQYGREIEDRAFSGTRDPEEWLLDAFGVTPSSSGERISPAVAMRITAFYACVRNISEDLAKLPKGIKRRDGKNRMDLPDHPVSRVMRHPSKLMNRHVFWQTFFAHALSTHGGFAYIVRDGAGRPAELVLLDPLSVQVLVSQDDGMPYFHVAGMRANEVLLPSEVFHVMGLSYSGVDGYTLPSLAKEVLGVAMALQKFRGKFFANGATASGILEHPAELSESAAKRLREGWKRLYGGSENSHAVITLEEGMKFHQISIDPERAELSSLLSTSVEEIARYFRMPPHKIGHLERATFSNIEHQGLEYDRDTLDPWADKWRAEVEHKLLSQAERDDGLYPYMNLNALMRADTPTRVAYYKDMYYMGVYSANEIRELEDEPPVEDGDRRFVQQNLVPADRVDDKIAAPNPGAGAQPQPQPQAAFQRMLEWKLSDILRFEIRNMNTAKNIDSFYGKHLANVAEIISDAVEVVGLGLGASIDAKALAMNYADLHVKRSRADIENEDFSEWQNGARACAAAASIMEEIQCNTGVSATAP